MEIIDNTSDCVGICELPMGATFKEVDSDFVGIKVSVELLPEGVRKLLPHDFLVLDLLDMTVYSPSITMTVREVNAKLVLSSIGEKSR